MNIFFVVLFLFVFPWNVAQFQRITELGYWCLMLSLETIELACSSVWAHLCVFRYLNGKPFNLLGTEWTVARTAGAGGESVINMLEEQLGPNCTLVIQSLSEISAVQAKVRVLQAFSGEQAFQMTCLEIMNFKQNEFWWQECKTYNLVTQNCAVAVPRFYVISISDTFVVL